MLKSLNSFESSTPLNYPGERNEGNFMLLGGETISDVSDNPREALEQFDELLAKLELPPIANRVPVLAFGRNASPTGAISKTEKYGHGEISPESLGTIPMLKGSLSGHDVVWHGRPGQVGSYFAELIDTPDTPDADVEAWVQFLTPEQLAIIHTTEGETYELSEVPGVDLGDGLLIDTVGYTAREASVAVDEQGRTISVAGIDRTGHSTEELPVREMLGRTLAHEAVQKVLDAQYDPAQYIAEGQAMKLRERKARQASVDKVLIEQKLKEDFRYEGDGLRFGRADFSSLPRGVANGPTKQDVIQLMEQAVADIRPKPEVLEQKRQTLREKFPDEPEEKIDRRARRLMDPVAILREKATTELLDPRREERLANLTLPHKNKTN